MSDDRDPHESESESNDGSAELEVVGTVAESALAIAQQVQGALEGDAPSESTAGSVLGGATGALHGASSALGASGADPAVRGVVSGVAQAAAVATQVYEAAEGLLEAGEAIVRELTGEADQHKVRYQLECAAEEDAGWRVREVEIEEQLGAPFVVRLSLITDDVDALPANLLGHDCTLRISRGDETSRSVHGLISRVDHGQRSERHLISSIEIVPALEVLRHVRDSRIFQKLTAIEVIDAYLGTYLGEYGREIRIETNGTYVQREYCVQYRETALEFFHRLCEEEGLTYYFDHSGDKEAVVVVDDNASFAPIFLLPTAVDVPFVAHRGGDIARAEPAYAFATSDRLGPTSLTVADFDWTSRTLPFSEEQRSRDAHDRGREQYEHARATTVGEYDEGQKRYTGRDVAARVQRGRERQALSTFEYRGAGAVTGFTVGTVFTLSGHPDAGLDGEYLLLNVRHRGRDTHAGDAAHAHGDESTLEYENEFVCIPSSVPYRPAHLTRKPRIHGVQTAMVVGPTDEEIWTDEHGRIRVQFHWDREGRNDQDSTCWVRVMQSWAGAGFGAMFIPRIGMEVVVSFLDGDPDRPLVTGCVYNATNTPPIVVPDDKTQSVLRTQSSPGGNGFNELRFEDKAREERVYLHAQKDLAEDVEHDHATRVKRNQSNTVDVDQTESVGRDQTLAVGRHRSSTVDGNETQVVKGSQIITVLGEQENDGTTGLKLSVTGKYDIDVSDETTIVTRNKTTIRVGESVFVMDPRSITLRAGGGATLILDEEVHLVSKLQSVVHLAATLHAEATDGATLDLAATATMAGVGGAVAELSDAVAIASANGSAAIALDTNAAISTTGNFEASGAMNATVTGTKEASLANATGGVTAAAAGVTVSGPTVEISGQATTTITGSMVDLN